MKQIIKLLPSVSRHFLLKKIPRNYLLILFYSLSFFCREASDSLVFSDPDSERGRSRPCVTEEGTSLCRGGRSQGYIDG